MKKLEPSSFSVVIPQIEKDPCGTVYPLSVAEKYQHGEIYTEGGSLLLWHQSGFAHIFGACGDDFLEQVYQEFLSPGAVLSRRFVLFTASPRTERFFRDRGGLVFGRRYDYAYPKEAPEPFPALPSGYHIREIDGELFDSLPGRITPRFSWRDPAEFTGRGKGFCVFYSGAPASWAFSAAVSSRDIDIGIETAEDFRQKGLALTAARSMIRYCFEQRKSPVWSCDANNTASQRTAEKLGFVKVSEYFTIKRQLPKF